MVDLGAMHARSWHVDPKHLAFVLARYHFVARMLTGYGRVLEVGCGDGTGATIVRQSVKALRGIDSDKELIPNGPEWKLHDIVRDGPVWFEDTEPGERRLILWDGIYALDVFEHIRACDQHAFFCNVLDSLAPRGVLILGTPSLESQKWASSESKKYHVNCRTEMSLRGMLNEYFYNVFLFGMNDTTLHVGFGPMCHYRLAIACGDRR